MKGNPQPAPAKKPDLVNNCLSFQSTFVHLGSETGTQVELGIRVCMPCFSLMCRKNERFCVCPFKSLDLTDFKGA